MLKSFQHLKDREAGNRYNGGDLWPHILTYSMSLNLLQRAIMPSDYLLLGSRGPSTVILMALWYVATCGGLVKTVIVKVKLFPETGNIICCNTLSLIPFKIDMKSVNIDS